MASLEKLTPPKDLDPASGRALYGLVEARLDEFRIYLKGIRTLGRDAQRQRAEAVYFIAINDWANHFLKDFKTVCIVKEDDNNRRVNNRGAAATFAGGGDAPPLSKEDMGRIVNSFLFLTITSSKEKQYSALTRAFFFKYGYAQLLNEGLISWTLKNPEEAVKEVEAFQKQQGSSTDTQVSQVRERHAQQSLFMRNMSIGLGAIAGGVLIGVTGGLAAPLVGAGMSTVLGFLGVGGTLIGTLASGLASSGLVCGALFGAYGARTTANMVEQHTRTIKDLKLLPLRGETNDTLAVRLCVTGWLDAPEDIVEPWSIFDKSSDTYALRWEMEALGDLSNAFSNSIKSLGMTVATVEVVKRTMFAAIMSSLSPLALLKLGQVINNPWTIACARAAKTGAVLGELLAQRVFGKRPVTLVGYSLGSLVIYEALQYLSRFPSTDSIHFVQDVFLFGTPTTSDPEQWIKLRRTVAGRLVNGYLKDDYVLAVLARASTVSWDIAGLKPVEVNGVENIWFEEVVGHAQWRTRIGACLRKCQAPGLTVDDIKEEILLKDNTPEDEDINIPEDSWNLDDDDIALDGGDIALDFGDITLDGGDIVLDGGDIVLDGGDIALDGGDIMLDGGDIAYNNGRKVVKEDHDVVTPVGNGGRVKDISKVTVVTDYGPLGPLG
ncbi:DUF726-domain-containing protein [Coprinopsis marcescibilis]|uniref:DUF726-domain-containing protein n=1 Tax=Coprinopsis marcescibilis TaxID=230819 RepID=A0A5C3LBY9_COPMA|nr:DUF726-domain-containing protein [Coprinopsis marcescibilis]